jgi:hypothetical protein
MPTIKFNAPAAGEHDVEIPADYLHKDDVTKTHVPKDQVEPIIVDRLTRATKGLAKPDDLVRNDEFLQRVATERKEDLVKLLGLPADKVDVPKIQQEAVERLNKETVEPLTKKVGELATDNATLQGRVLDAQVTEASVDLNVDPELRDLVKLFVRQNFAWDPEKKEWFQKKAGGEGFEFSGDPNNTGQPYVMVKEYLTKIKREGKNKSWFLAGTQNGSSFSNTGDASTMTAERYDKLPPAEKTKFAVEHPDRFAAIMEEKQQAGERKLVGAR